MAKVNPVIEHYKTQLKTNPRWAVRGLVVIFEQQTATEQSAEATTDANGRGFTAFDADILSAFAKLVMAGKQLSSKQMDVVFTRMPKYAKQLVGLSKTKEAA